MGGAQPSLQERLREELERVGERRFLEAAMGAGALVSLADGSGAACERRVLVALLEELGGLRCLDPDQAAERYEGYLDALRGDAAATRREILGRVGEFAGVEPAASLILRICLEIGKADQVFQQREYRALGELAEVLKLDLDRL